jgi:proteasome lid subunit RPN8/RPN11
MRCTYRICRDLLGRVHEDLNRRHPFAAERVGFFFGRAGRIGSDGLVILATDYEPIADEDYVNDSSVGAMMGSTAIRKALERALDGGTGDLSVFHVHRHEHHGPPWFSSVDLSESAKFAPSFFHVAPKIPHGVIVLSHGQAAGLWWTSEDAEPQRIDRIVSVGAPLRYWDASR